MGKQRQISKIVVEATRYLLAIVLLFSGFVKSIDPVGGGLKMVEYMLALGMPAFRPYATIFAVLLSSFEFMIGALLLMGLWRKLTAWLVLVFMSFMTLISLYLALFNPITDCGCFGDAIHLTNWQTFSKNIPLLLASILYCIGYNYIHPLFKNTGAWIMTALALFGILFLNYRSWQYLPIVDFRPFKVGNSLQSLILVPENAPQDEYDYTFIYEKGGEKRAFLMDSLPDESWQYVERHEKLIKKGYHPPVKDFSLFSEGRDITDQILHNSGPMIWILSPDWQKADRGTAGRINRLYKTASAKGVLVFAISGSDQDNVERWRNATGAAYDNVLLDATTIKTIIRSNPGILFIENGVIKAKVPGRGLPRSNAAMEQFVEHAFSSRHNVTMRAIVALTPLIAWLLAVLLALLIPERNKKNAVIINKY